MKRDHPAVAHSTLMVILLIHIKNDDADYNFRAEVVETDCEDLAAFNPPPNTRAYAYFWQHDVKVTGQTEMCKTILIEHLGPLFTDHEGFPTEHTLADDCAGVPHLFKRPYSLLCSNGKGRVVVVRDMNAPQPATTPA